MKRYRYITDPTAKRRTALNTVPLFANNQLPANANVCFRVCIHKNTDITLCGGYSTTHDTRRLEEMGLVLRIRKNGDWETRALMPDDNRDLKTIAKAVAKEMADAGYVLDTTDGEGFVPADDGKEED